MKPDVTTRGDQVVLHGTLLGYEMTPEEAEELANALIFYADTARTYAMLPNSDWAPKVAITDLGERGVLEEKLPSFTDPDGGD